MSEKNGTDETLPEAPDPEHLRAEADRLRVEVDDARVVADQDRVTADDIRLDAGDKLRAKADEDRLEADHTRTDADEARTIADEARMESGDTMAQHLMIGLTANMQVMASNVGTMAQTIKSLGISFREKEKRDTGRWITIGLVCVALAFSVFYNRASLSILQEATGDDAKAAQKKFAEEFSREVDCDGEVNLIVLSTSVSSVVRDFPIPELSPECQVFYKNHPDKLTLPTVTTTTTIP